MDVNFVMFDILMEMRVGVASSMLKMGTPECVVADDEISSLMMAT